MEIVPVRENGRELLLLCLCFSRASHVNVTEPSGESETRPLRFVLYQSGVAPVGAQAHFTDRGRAHPRRLNAGTQTVHPSRRDMLDYIH